MDELERVTWWGQRCPVFFGSRHTSKPYEPGKHAACLPGS